MLGSYKFHRSFIILKPEDMGFEIQEGREPAGYVKLELRNNFGKMLIYIQDMRPADPQQAIYDVVLVSNRKEVDPVKLTSIQLPGSGRGEFEIVFDPDDVGETGNSIGDYHALAVVERQLSDISSLRYPLVGYSDKKVKLNWNREITGRLLHMYMLSRGSEALEVFGAEGLEQQREGESYAEAESAESGSEKANIMAVEIPELEEEAEHGEALSEQPGSEGLMEQKEAEALDYSQKSEVLLQHQADEAGLERQEDVHEEKGPEKTAEDQIDPELLKFKPPDISYIYEDDSQLKQEEMGSARNTDQSQDTEEQDFYSMQLGGTSYWSRVEEYYNRLFDSHKKVTPFDDAVGEVEWIRIENVYGPVYPFYGTYNPCYPYYRRSRCTLDHYLIGLMREKGKVKYVIYGIPGIYSAAPPMSLHGFSRWLPVKNGYGAGYWLLYIDALTGNIAYPY